MALDYRDSRLSARQLNDLIKTFLLWMRRAPSHVATINGLRVAMGTAQLRMRRPWAPQTETVVPAG